MVEFQQTLREFTTPNSLFAALPSLFDFDDTYTCDVCTGTHLCSIYAEIEVALQVDIFYEIYIDKVDVAEVNVILAAKNLPLIEKPHALELKPLRANLK